MTVLLPAALLAAGVAVAVGLPAPSRLDLFRPARPGASPPALGWQLSSRAVLAPLAGGLLALSGPAAAAGGLLGALLARRAWVRRTTARARAEERAGAGEALAVLAAELRAGRPPGASLEAAAAVATGPLAETLLAAARSGRFGADPATCLRRGAEASAVPAVLSGLAACWQVCASTGSSLAAAVERLAEGLRAEQVQRLAVEAELAGPRATAAMLAVLPVAGVALAAGLGAQPVHVLLHTPVGMGCLTAGIGLDLLGLWWTGRLVAAAGGVR